MGTSLSCNGPLLGRIVLQRPIHSRYNNDFYLRAYLCLEKKNHKFEKYLRKRWRLAREKFAKEIRLEEKLGDQYNKKERYRHYEALCFLKPFVGSESTFSTVIYEPSTNDVQVDENMEDDKYNVAFGKTDEIEIYMPTNSEMYLLPSDPLSEESAPSINPDSSLDPIASTHMELKKENLDERTTEESLDKTFLLSLLPALREVPEEKKLRVKIQIQQILSDALS
ncbi:uncharacterized protein LOC103575653 isoform X2 [Microplitis demolitor]|uniref:uncharacterized protein LOC103575653 isoform X2 n=1 Tax=Microplitis demolitor TaxID=69319 RepID=UPI0004CDCAD8|nr:uncharacterized protein LOC103575653 isoform X2 [Microplitis demolitor]